MTTLQKALAQAVGLFQETSGVEWSAEGPCVVHDADIGVYRGHIAECVEDDDAAFMAACHELFRLHGNDIEAAVNRPVARPLNEWHEDHGFCTWFAWDGTDWLGEPSYIGSPNCDDWPGYHTHFTPHPPFPKKVAAMQADGAVSPKLWNQQADR